MGNSQSAGKSMFESRSKALELFQNVGKGVGVITSNFYSSASMAPISILGDSDSIKQERLEVQDKLLNDKFDPKEDRALGALLGNVSYLMVLILIIEKRPLVTVWVHL